MYIHLLDHLHSQVCKELFQLQSEFYTKAVQDYTAEATRMFEMMTKATQDTMKEATASHARKYDDVPL